VAELLQWEGKQKEQQDLPVEDVPPHQVQLALPAALHPQLLPPPVEAQRRLHLCGAFKVENALLVQLSARVLSSAASCMLALCAGSRRALRDRWWGGGGCEAMPVHTTYTRARAHTHSHMHTHAHTHTRTHTHAHTHRHTHTHTHAHTHTHTHKLTHQTNLHARAGPEGALHGVVRQPGRHAAQPGCPCHEALGVTGVMRVHL